MTWSYLIVYYFQDTLQPHIPVTECPQTLQFWTDYAGGTERTLCSHEEDINRPLDIPVNSHATVNLRTSRSFMMILIVQGMLTEISKNVTKLVVLKNNILGVSLPEIIAVQSTSS